MRVAAAKQIHMQREAAVRRQRTKELRRERHVVITQLLPRRRLGMIGEKRATADVHDDACERVVQRHAGLAEPADPASLAQRLSERLPQDDPDVFHGVVLVHVQVAARFDLERPVGVPR
jgi:hypothetical protein